MVRLLARIVGVGIETADMLVHEVLSRRMRDWKAVARFAGLTDAPDESGAKRREQGLAKASNARVRRGMIQLAWRFLLFQKGSALIHGGRRLAGEGDSVITNDVNAHGWSLLFHVSAVPTLTTLTLSSRSKASSFRIILWRCWTAAEHEIAHHNRAIRNRQYSTTNPIERHPPTGPRQGQCFHG
jgi:hypothetical protein